MVSLAEKLKSKSTLSSNLNKGNTLRDRVLFTILMLVIYRLGTYIPIPGINPIVLKSFLADYSQGLLGMFDLFSGGALGRMTIFALNIIPYITSSIMMQLFVIIIPSLAELKKEGEAGRRQINQYTRYLTLIVCFVQAFSIAAGIESLQASGVRAVDEPGILFKLMTALTLTSGTFFVLWLGEKITERGIGNGVSLIIFAGIVSNLPFSLVTLFTLGEKGTISPIVIILILIGSVAAIYFIVFMETAQRRVVVKYPKRQVGNNKMAGGETSYLPLKINNAGVVPPIFASSLLLVPTTIVSFLGMSNTYVAEFQNYFSRGSAIYLILYAALIVFFAFFYVSVVFNSTETSKNLKNSGGIILGIKPGEATSKYLDFILNRLTFIGSVYLVLVCLLPETIITQLSLPFYLGGTSLLIVVTVTIDTVSQIQSHLMSKKYESMLKKAKIGRK